MKKYFGKQVTEAARGGSRMRSVKAREYGRFVVVDGELEYEGLQRLPVRQKGAKLILRDCKDFSDKLGPLKNFLRSSCGRLWDDVFSEISHELGRGGRGVQHILSAHLDVATSTYRGADGHVYGCSDRGIHRVGGWHDDFYVEPETGILRPSANYRTWRSIRRERERAKPIESIALAEGKEYRKIHGLWFYCEYVDVETIVPVAVFGGRIRMEATTKRITEFKRQLGKKQLKALKLKNDHYAGVAQSADAPVLGTGS